MDEEMEKVRTRLRFVSGESGEIEGGEGDNIQ